MEEILGVFGWGLVRFVGTTLGEVVGVVLFDLPLWLWEVITARQGAGRSSYRISREVLLSFVVVLTVLLAVFLH